MKYSYNFCDVEMKKTISILLLSVLVFWGCNAPSQQVAEEKLSFTLLPVSAFIGLPIQIMAFDSVLLINDFYGDTLVHRISLKTGKETAKWGIKGNGPNEVLSPLHLMKTSDSLFVFSRPQWTLYSVTDRQSSLSRKVRVFTDISLLFPLGDSGYLASGMFADKRFCLLDENGNEQMRFGDYPCFWNRESGLPIEVKRMFHQVRGYGFSDKHGFVVAGSHVLSFYKPHSSGYSLEKEICLAPYEYGFNERGMESTVNLKTSFVNGAVDLAVSDEYVYVLFDNNSLESSVKRKKEIWRYDWKGNLLNRYIPDVELSLITVASDGRLVGLTDSEEPSIAFVSGDE